jgi:hypothetical protein
MSHEQDGLCRAIVGQFAWLTEIGSLDIATLPSADRSSGSASSDELFPFYMRTDRLVPL